jgi:hypothetical protein
MSAASTKRNRPEWRTCSYMRTSTIMQLHSQLTINRRDRERWRFLPMKYHCMLIGHGRPSYMTFREWRGFRDE